MQPLGVNKTGYLGESIEIHSVLQQMLDRARETGWQTERLAVAADLEFLAFRREHPNAIGNVYLSAGIHGDEPAGPLAVLELLRQDQWPAAISFWICPCLNPTGFPLRRRENRDGRDLNREYRDPQSPEVKAHTAWLAQQPAFDLTLLLHEDWEARGFYVYELNPENQHSLAEPIVDTVSKVCPIDHSTTIDGRIAERGIIRPSTSLMTRPDWPEAFYLTANKSRLSYTLEAPSDFTMPTRVKALVTGVRAALDHFTSPAV